MPKQYFHGPLIWKVMRRNAWEDIANSRIKTTQQSYKVATPCLDDHHFKDDENESVGELSTCLLTNCSQMSFI